MTEDSLERAPLSWPPDAGYAHHYQYPQDCADAAVEPVLQQAQMLGEEWGA